MNTGKPSARESLEILSTLTEGAVSFSEREKGLVRARQMRDSNLRQSIAEQKQALEREVEESISQARDAAGLEVSEIEEVFAQRKIRLDQAQITVRNQVIASIQEAEGAVKGALQRDLMLAGRTRETQLAAAEQEFQSESAQSTSIQNRCVKLEKAIVKSLRGFRPSQKKVIAALKASDSPGESKSAEDLEARYERLRDDWKSYRANPLAGWFNSFPVALQCFLILLIGAAVPFASPQLGGPGISYPVSLGVALLFMITVLALFFSAKGKAKRFADEVAPRLAEIKEGRLAFKQSVADRQKKSLEAIEASYAEVKRSFDSGMSTASGKVKGIGKYNGPEEVEARVVALKTKLDEGKKKRLDSVSEGLSKKEAELLSAKEKRLNALSTEEGQEALASDLEQQFRSLVAQWSDVVVGADSKLRAEEMAGPQWKISGAPGDWVAPEAFVEAMPFGEVHYSGSSLNLALPESSDMRLPAAPDYTVPLRLRIPDSASILVETKNFLRDEAVDFLNYLGLGWLANSPPGRISFSLFDPVGLGESFAGFMHLADYEELLINTRIRTQPDQIEARLGELTDHMEKVIQMYLRSDYETITQYNHAAGTIAERYHFVVVADFPHGFTEIAARRLASIASAGARCGVFLLLHHDQRADLPQGFQMDDLRKSCFCLRSNIDGFFVKDNPVSGTSLTLAKAPPADEFASWIHKIGEANRDSNRIEVPFSFIAPGEEQMWSESTGGELRVPIGRSGATKLQYLALGKGTCQHSLIAGKTGSGKSTLFHIIVTNLALWADPNEVEFYLIDFKKGVEFKCYADYLLPHARVVAIESDREFGLSVLQRLDEELKHRGEVFRAAGVQDVSSFRDKNPDTPMPRTLLLIDEFQEFFTEDDPISQQAAVLLDRIVRQGRAFGIHAVLGSQTLGGAFTLARATLGQMTVRIALACNEADAYLIMDDSNPAPRLLTRPGEGIYNDRAGAVEANSPFQVVWLGEQERNEYLAKVESLANEKGLNSYDRVVFEGNAPALIDEDRFITKIVEKDVDASAASVPRVFLGAPNAIKGPTEVRFDRQSGANLIVVGQRDDAVDAMLLASMKILRCEWGEKVRIVLVDNRFSQPSDPSGFCEMVREVGGVETPPPHEIESKLNELASELKSISEGEGSAGQVTMLVIPGLHRYKKLRFEEDFSFSMDEDAEQKASDSLQELISEGPGWGFHVITSVDSYNSVGRTLGRKAAGEFEKKVLFQMGAADSASLIDTGKASELGLNRALYYDEPTGAIEIFRPFAQPTREWMER